MSERRLRNIALILFGIILGLFVAELGLHWALPALDYHFPVYRLTDDQFTRRAGQSIAGNGTSYRFDADGFRVAGEARGAQSVLFIGDSFTQGFGSDAGATFPAVTCRELRARGIDARCLNGGVTGFGTTHELRLLRTLLQRSDLDIRAVVFQLCPYNDLRDNWEDGGFGVEAGKLVEYSPPRVPLGVWLRANLLENPFARSSRLVVLAANALYDPDQKSDASTLELEKQLVAQVAVTTRQRHVPLLFVVAASSRDIDQISSEPYDEPWRFDQFVTLAQNVGVPTLDTRKIARSPDLYIPDDGHLSAAGNAVVGKAVADLLAASLAQDQ